MFCATFTFQTRSRTAKQAIDWLKVAKKTFVYE